MEDIALMALPVADEGSGSDDFYRTDEDHSDQYDGDLNSTFEFEQPSLQAHDAAGVPSGTSIIPRSVYLRPRHNKLWVCKDQSPDQNFLSKCKHCLEGKRYNAFQYAIAHLRRIHFNPKAKGEKRSTSFDPPMSLLKLWVEEINEPMPLKPLKHNEAPWPGIYEPAFADVETL